MNDDLFLDRLRDRFDDAHASTPGAGSPPPDLWTRVLSDHTTGRSRTVNATMSPEIAEIRPAPRSRRTTRQEGRSRRSPGFGYAAAAILLVLALFGGMFVANQRGPEDRFGDLRYAAQPVSPEATATAAQQCDVEPLSVDEVLAIVDDPYVGMDSQRMNIAGIPDFLDEEGSALILPDGVGAPPGPETEAEARKIVDDYLRCRETGTLGQVFALLSPNKVRQHVLAPFPTFRTEDEVRSYVESVFMSPSRDFLYSPLYEMGVTVVPATGEDSVLAFAFHPDYPTVWVGTQGLDEDGNVLAVSDAYDTMIKGRDLEGPERTFGAVSLIQYPGVDRWYVHDDEVFFRTDQDPTLGTPAAAVCSVEPMTAEAVLAILDDSDAYAERTLGMDPMTPEGADVLEAIRDEPESLVLATVTSDSDPAMLVIPQEGVLPAAEFYLECWQYGSAAQAFALMAPHMIAEYDSLVGLPREAEELQALLDAPARELPVSDRIMPTFVLDDGREVTLADSEDPQGYASLPGGFEVTFVGTYMWDSIGTPLLGANIDDRARIWVGDDVEVDGRMSFGALTLVRYPGTERWLVYDHWIELDPAPVQLP